MLGGEADRAVVEVLVCGAAVSSEDVLSESLPQLAASSARGISRQRAREVRGGGSRLMIFINFIPSDYHKIFAEGDFAQYLDNEQ